ncbi:Uncharacterized protein AXF42_Ash003304 [Apostasia shenzhenica]|uniref:60S ribosomal protein L34 n=1 Tax=Apostasia shenzhenica TaxID=1088818 RepID=A0A2I0BFT6_9ASPA|nr:Uncharacterized protein AXF42_Ash003304 [Apostasia shenzhenica]
MPAASAASVAVSSQIQRSNKKKPQSDSPNPIKIPPCPHKKSAIVDISILVAVLFACGFLLFPYLKLFSYGFFDLWKTSLDSMESELGITTGAYLLILGIGFLLFCFMIYLGFSCFTRQKCDNPNCRGLRNAPEFDIKIETEDCLKNLSNSSSGDGGESGFFELGEDYNKELAAELKKMAPLNGRAVLIFRAKCGCSAGRMIVWGPKKTRKASK